MRIKTMKQIATSRTIPSFRSLRSISGLPTSAVDQQRQLVGQLQTVAADLRRQWLNGQMEHRRDL